MSNKPTFNSGDHFWECRPPNCPIPASRIAVVNIANQDKLKKYFALQRCHGTGPLSDVYPSTRILEKFWVWKREFPLAEATANNMLFAQRCKIDRSNLDYIMELLEVSLVEVK